MLWSPNLQLHYPFENTANDYSGNARHGTVNGSGVYATRPNGGRCLYFDGVGDLVTTPSFGLSGTVVGFDAQVRCTTGLYYQAFLAENYYSGALGFLYIGTISTNDCLFAYANGAAIEARSTNFFAAPYSDVWLHAMVVADFSGKNIYFYRNGLLFETVAMTGTPLFPSTARVKYVGAYDAAGNDPLKAGYLQNVRLWSLPTMPAAAQMLANANRLMLGMNPIW